MTFINRFALLSRWLTSRCSAARMRCPSCGGEPDDILDRRFLVLTLARCQQCGLLYRQPTDTAKRTNQYYQGEYHDSNITDIPTDAELRELVNSNFATQWHRGSQVALVRHLTGPGNFKILDYGCSWGYALYQFLQAGFIADGFELGCSRADFAAKWLHVPVYSNLADVKGPYRAVIASHVYEHVPALESLLKRLKDTIEPGGFFISITPNGNTAFRAENPYLWSRLWGHRHPVYIDVTYLLSQFIGWDACAITRRAFSNESFPPLEWINETALNSRTVYEQGGDELVFIARKPASRSSGANV
jgi:SAM-dependent methyltransferase